MPHSFFNDLFMCVSTWVERGRVCVCARMHVLHVWAPTEGRRKSWTTWNLSYSNYDCLTGLLGTDLQSPTKAIHTVDLGTITLATPYFTFTW